MALDTDRHWDPTVERPGHRPPPPPARTSRLVLVAVLALGLFLGAGRLGDLLPSFGNPFRTETVDRSQPTLLQALDDLSEYRAAVGQFQVVIDVEEDTRFVPSLIRGERTVFLAGGSVAAFVDFADLDDEAVEVSEDGQSVTITLPPARLSDPEVDPERSYVLNRERGLLDRIGSVFSDSPTSERQLYLLAGDKLAEAATESGLAERAERNTEAMLRTVLGSLGYEDVTVVYTEPGNQRR